MDNNDLKIAGVRREIEEAKFKDIYAGEVRCGNEILHFERVNLYENIFSIMLPDDYQDLPKSLVKLKYPSENRPAIIKTNEDTTVNFAFGYYKQDFAESQVESAARGLKAGLGKISSGARLFETQILHTEDGVKFSCFDFTTPALDTELYQIFGFVPVRGRFLHYIFNAPSQMMRTWKPVAMQVLQSIHDIDGDTV